MRKFTQRKKQTTIFQTKKNRSWKILFTIILLILVILIFLIFKIGFFNIKKLEINLGQNLNCINEEQIKEDSQLIGQNLLLVDSIKFSTTIKGKFICIKSINLSKHFPNKIKLDILGREVKAKLINLNNEASSSGSLENIATPSAGQSPDGFLVDDKIIFAKDESLVAIPQIYLHDPSLFLGKEVNTLIKYSLDILEKLKVLGLNIQTTQIKEQFFIVFPNTSQPKIIFSLDNDLNTQIASLQLILEKAKIDSSQVEFVDLRFDKPVIRIAPKSR